MCIRDRVGGLPAGVVAHAAQPSIVRLFVPFMAGGDADGSARNFVESATRVGGLVFEIVHLTAESGAAAGRAVKQAPPDGQTLLLARVGSVSILPALSPHTAPPVGDFTVLAVLDQAPLVCAVRTGTPVQSMRELLAAIAATPGQLRYSTAGAGSLQNLAVRYLLDLSGLPADAAKPCLLYTSPASPGPGRDLSAAGPARRRPGGSRRHAQGAVA